ncbi:uncharacterized protein Dana_GF27121 [Drosophila ananassae]|uniref:Uncharacterized protein n=1 Tax=Drosophila ananassae TaxID=7217 RepID=A0A0P9AX98_DROAN|nr:uncharacterized protein Dana_GF27121 [Drosophila ananassae]
MVTNVSGTCCAAASILLSDNGGNYWTYYRDYGSYYIYISTKLYLVSYLGAIRKNVSGSGLRAFRQNRVFLDLRLVAMYEAFKAIQGEFEELDISEISSDLRWTVSKLVATMRSEIEHETSLPAEFPLFRRTQRSVGVFKPCLFEMG